MRHGSLEADVPSIKRGLIVCLISGSDMKVFAFGCCDGETNFAEVGVRADERSL